MGYATIISNERADLLYQANKIKNTLTVGVNQNNG